MTGPATINGTLKMDSNMEKEAAGLEWEELAGPASWGGWKRWRSQSSPLGYEVNDGRSQPGFELALPFGRQCRNCGCDRQLQSPEHLKVGRYYHAQAPIEMIRQMSLAWSCAFALLLFLVSCAEVGPFHDDSHYVPRGPRTGYYLVRPGSTLSHQLGLEAAPTIDTADPFRHGYGADALAFSFDHAGILNAPPAYIVQATPNDFYTRRIGSLIRGKSSADDVKTFFGRPQRIERSPDGFTAYYAIEVYDPYYDRSAGRR